MLARRVFGYLILTLTWAHNILKLPQRMLGKYSPAYKKKYMKLEKWASPEQKSSQDFNYCFLQPENYGFLKT